MCFQAVVYCVVLKQAYSICPEDVFPGQAVHPGGRACGVFGLRVAHHQTETRRVLHRGVLDPAQGNVGEAIFNVIFKHVLY